MLVLQFVWAALMSNGDDDPLVMPGLDAVKLYPRSCSLRERFENVATPLTVFSVVVPDSVEPPGLLPSAIVTGTPEALELASWTFTAGVIGWLAIVLVGCCANWFVSVRWAGGQAAGTRPAVATASPGGREGGVVFPALARHPSGAPLLRRA